MTELTEKQKEQMEAAWKEYYGDAWGKDLEPIDTPILFKAGYTAAVSRECVWRKISPPGNTRKVWSAVCGFGWTYTDAGTPNDEDFTFCPHCGGKVKEGK
ncbi:MAG: hypothetical protein KF855_03275 [Acidobacteria bacterium]|nr:hypothetical protein [Acidobacteriota bacterium]